MWRSFASAASSFHFTATTVTDKKLGDVGYAPECHCWVNDHCWSRDMMTLHFVRLMCSKLSFLRMDTASCKHNELMSLWDHMTGMIILLICSWSYTGLQWIDQLAVMQLFLWCVKDERDGTKLQQQQQHACTVLTVKAASSFDRFTNHNLLVFSHCL